MIFYEWGNGGRAEFIFKLVQICQENRATYVLRSPQPRIFLCTFYLGFVSGMIQVDDPAAALLSQTEGVTMIIRCLLASY